MAKIEIDLEFVTPCFLGGADQQAEWRAASVRGQLRWWFRAVAGGEHAGNLERVRQDEVAIFGSPESSSALVVRATGKPGYLDACSQPGWGRVLSDEQLVERWGVPPGTQEAREALARVHLRFPVNPLLYLGYGCLEFVRGERDRCRLVRRALAPGERAGLTLGWRRSISPERLELFERALGAWLLLGGIGSRSRRGFGSLRALGTTGLARSPVPTTRAEYLESVRALLPGAPSDPSEENLPEWSHLSAASRVAVARQGARSWDEALVTAGAWLMAFRRRYGYPADHRTAHGHGLTNRDYVWAGFEEPRPMPPPGVPDRAGFGLPLPFGQPDDQIVTWGNRGEDHRRASPLLIHVARLGVLFFPVLTHLPARLVPAGETVRFRGLRQPAVPPTAEQVSIVDRFLDDLAAAPKNRVEILS